MTAPTLKIPLRTSPATAWQQELKEWQDRGVVVELVEGLKSWNDVELKWKPMQAVRHWFSHAMVRCEETVERIDQPLLIATYGGTGCGKSTLINALVGAEVSKSGRERPTTKKPQLICHEETDLSKFVLPVENLEITRHSHELLRQIVLIDCPDPDSSETSMEGSNTARLKAILPHCDVLIFVTTQQKYRSAKVMEELLCWAAGCRFVFVQTHAEIDQDIRNDWRRLLEDYFIVPEIFLIDSVAAQRAVESVQSMPAEFARLLKTLSQPRGIDQRYALRLSNACEQMLQTVDLIEQELSGFEQPVAELQNQLAFQQQRLLNEMSSQLNNELTLSRGLWEQRLLSEVLSQWAMSPFSSMLRLYNSLGTLAASFGIMRARTTAHLAIIGAMQGLRWLGQQQQDQQAKDRIRQMQVTTLDEQLLQEVSIVIAGYAQSAGFSSITTHQETKVVSEHAVDLEQSFLVKATRMIDDIILNVAKEQTRFSVRVMYESLFLLYVGFVVARVGYNFFWESLWEHERIMKLDFYIPAGIFFILWTGGLIMSYLHRSQKLLFSRLQQTTGLLSEMQLPPSVFQNVRQQLQQAIAQHNDLRRLKSELLDVYGRYQVDNRELGHVKMDRPSV